MWAQFAAAMIWQAHIRPPDLVADDAMRLAQVRDLLNGQSWFDVTQWRMNPPAGVHMHWSRTIDAPLAGLILFFRNFGGEQQAEALAVTVWPLLLLLAAWLAIARIAVRLAGREAGVMALFLSLSCIFVLGYFHPGEIDHHNAQMVLTLWSVALLIDSERSPAAAGWCGVLVAVSLQIGLETLPYVMAICACMGALWVIRGDKVAMAMRWFGICLSAAAVVLTFGVMGTYERTHVDCQTFSAPHAIATIAAGFLFALLTAAKPFGATAQRRGIAIVAFGAALTAAFLLMAPNCSAGPFDWVGPEVRRIWLSRIEEAQSPLATAPTELAFFFASYVYAAVGLIGCALTAWLVPAEERFAAIAVLLVSAAALLVCSFEVRGAPFAIFLALPGLAAALRLGVARVMRPGLIRAGALIGALAVMNDFTFVLFGSYALEGIGHVNARDVARAAAMSCMGASAVQGLEHLPKGNVAAFVDVTPAILLHTDHSVMAGSYNDPAAIYDTYRLFTAPPDQSRIIAWRHNVAYVMTCSHSNDYIFFRSEGGANGLLSQLERGAIPSWLAPLHPPGTDPQVRIYRVLPGAK